MLFIAVFRTSSNNLFVKRMLVECDPSVLRGNCFFSVGNCCQVVSGGVASNQYIRKGLQTLADVNDFAFLCPPPRLCTDNGVMIAW